MYISGFNDDTHEGKVEYCFIIKCHYKIAFRKTRLIAVRGRCANDRQDNYVETKNLILDPREFKDFCLVKNLYEGDQYYFAQQTPPLFQIYI